MLIYVHTNTRIYSLSEDLACQILNFTDERGSLAVGPPGTASPAVYLASRAVMMRHTSPRATESPADTGKSVFYPHP